MDNLTDKERANRYKQLYNSELALRLDLESEVGFLNNKINAQEQLIKNLASQLPKRKDITWVVCRNYAEFVSLGYPTRRTQHTEFKYLNSVDYLSGISNPKVIFDGNWIDHPHVNDIIIQIKVATRDAL